MSKYIRKSAQRGQAIVLIALCMIVLLAFAGLALDGGRLYAEHRMEQNAADAAAGAASVTKCFTNGDPIAKAIELATSNGFPPSSTVTVDVKELPYNPATIVPMGTISYHDYQATITASIQSSFLQYIGIDSMWSTATAIDRCIDKRIALERATIAALCQNCNNTMNVSGSGVNVDGGVYSAHDIKVTSSIGGGTIAEGYYTSTLQDNGGITWGSPPQKLNAPVSDPGLFKASDYAPGGQFATAPYCYINGDLTVNFSAGQTLPNCKYYVTGNVKFIGSASGTLNFSMVAQGNIDVSASNATMSALVNNLLFYSVNGHISISSSNTTWNGIMYAPSQNGDFKFADSGNSTIDGGIMAYTVDIHSSGTNIMRNPGVSMELPPLTIRMQ